MRQRVAVAALLIVAAPLAILCGRGRPSRRCRRWLARLLRAPPLPPDRTLLQRIHTVVYDCDGVLYQNAQAVPGVPESLARMRSSGKRLLFVTNAASSSRASLAAKLGQLGIGGVRPDDCITSAYAAATFLATMHPDVKSAYVVGGGGLLEELRAAGIEPVGEDDVDGLEALIATGGLKDNVDAVVVGMQTEGLCYARLAKAAAYARDRSRPFIGTNPDANWPAGLTELLPAGGCNVRYVSYAAEREPDAVVGKPSGDLARLVAAVYGLRPEATLMVGDRCNTDIAFGHAVGWSALLVLTGCHTLEDALRAPAHQRPDYITQSAADLDAYL